MNNLSIIGCGFVGNAIYNTFSPYYSIKIYDKFKSGFNSLKETLDHSDVIFVCLPTPVADDMSQDLSNIIESLCEADRETEDRKIFVIKSTVLPGTTRKLKEIYNKHGFVFSPEFLTERNAIFDSINTYRVILGSDNKNDIDRVEEIHKPVYSHVKLFKTNFEEAELVKYICNCFFSAKVSIMNEIYDICKGLGIEYEKVRQMFLADQRIANSHTMVPGPDGHRGFGGKCFYKDLNSFIFWCKEHNFNVDMFDAANRVNERVREYKDWLEIKGATSKNNYC